MKIAIPRFGEEIAPGFEVAAHLSVFEAGHTQATPLDLLSFNAPGGLDRVRALLAGTVNILICSGIGNQYKSMLQASGITVIDHVTGTIAGVLDAFYNGELCGSQTEPIFRSGLHGAPLNELLDWTIKAFQEHGYEVRSARDMAPFPVDLVARMQCPGCGKLVRIAICCGMHTYRVDQEIREFHHAASGSFDACIYIHDASPEVEKTCKDFGIQLLIPVSGEPDQVPVAATSAFRLFRIPLERHKDCLQTA
ncbi:MAG TPA: hypothetical protein VF398_07140 [bacterium]